MWSGAFIAGKFAVQEFPPFALTFLRFLFALPLIFGLLYWREPGNLAPRSGQWRPLVVLGLIGTFGYHALFFIALNHTTAINSALIGAMNPMITMLLAALFFQEGLSVKQVYWCVPHRQLYQFSTRLYHCPVSGLFGRIGDGA
ncbi:DMT family transporter [Dendrosporobacter quercicolus]|uniref:DMT family transporter n=1 Tax=Dendrosporobacter quercicolus TaxID=146817 RepID=UPI003BF7AA0B